jgi:hypothetical protein
VREGLYIATKILFDGWNKQAGDALGSGFLDALSSVLDRNEYLTWQRLVKFRNEPRSHESIWLQLAAQAPHSYELIDLSGRPVSYPHSQQAFGDEMVSTGMRLIESGKYDAGISVLTCSAGMEFAGTDAIDPVQNSILTLPSRVARVPTSIEPVIKELGTATMLLASTGHFAAAIHTRLMMPLLNGDLPEFTRLGQRTLELGGLQLTSASGEPLGMSVRLNSKGYRAQAIELLIATTGIAPGDQTRWEDVYEGIKELAQPSGTSRFVTKLAAPAAAAVGFDLRPTSDFTSRLERAATRTDKPILTNGLESIRTNGLESSDAATPRRRVNAWLKEDETYPSDEFDVWVNIGPPREGAMGGDFKEPNWIGREFIELRLVLSGLDAEIRPGWHHVTLPRVGATEDVAFRVKTSFVGNLDLWLRVYAAKEMMLLDEHNITISLRKKERQAA